MKVFVWIYLVIFIILTPLFIYDMYVEKSINFSFVVGIILLFYFFSSYFKGKRKD